MEMDLDPVDAVVVPGGHSLQIALVDPVESSYDPNWQARHTLIPVAFANVPVEQLVQVEAALAPMTEEADPVGHGRHCEAKKAPWVARYLPVGQLVQ